MKHLKALNKYFWKYRFRLFGGIFFVILSNYFAVLAPEITGYIVSKVQQHLPGAKDTAIKEMYGKPVQLFINWINQFTFSQLIIICCVTILLLALLRGLLMFFMRQTIIVMSRHIEYDLKNDIYNHYQELDNAFYKTNSTGDLMNRITEDVSRVRMYAGPAIMYLTNLIALISFSLYNMFRKDAELTFIIIAPLPLLAIMIYFVNTLIHKKSEKVQRLLSMLTTNAQESYSGIRVIKSFVQEKAMLGFFKTTSESYRKNAVNLAKIDAFYFPGISLLIGLSTLLTILIGGQMALNDPTKVGIIVEFIIYINMLQFPVSSIGWVASMVQRAAASQQRLNEFLQTESSIPHTSVTETKTVTGDIQFKDVTFTYPHTGIQALKKFSIKINEGDKVLVLGKTGSGKSTIPQLLLKFYIPQKGEIIIGDKNINQISLKELRSIVSYVPQDVFLFSDTVAANISFGLNKSTSEEDIKQASKYAGIDKEIMQLPKGYETAVGERGITLSGGQKQRVSIARALLKQGKIILLDDCLSAVDTKTENRIVNNLNTYLKGKTTILITHRIFTSFNFDNIIVLEDGVIVEQGTHDVLLSQNGYYRQLYDLQTKKTKQTERV